MIGCIQLMANTLNSLPVQRGASDLWLCVGVEVVLALAGLLAFCFFAALVVVFSQVENYMRGQSEGVKLPGTVPRPNHPLQQTGPALQPFDVQRQVGRPGC
jgi:hypothetical protein